MAAKMNFARGGSIVRMISSGGEPERVI